MVKSGMWEEEWVRLTTSTLRSVSDADEAEPSSIDPRLDWSFCEVDGNMSIPNTSYTHRSKAGVQF
jgi:hypothetical protein